LSDEIISFYDELAAHYHLIFDDWPRAIERQGKILGAILNLYTSNLYTSGQPLKILDCACGIGTQALGLAAMGHQVVASDISHAEVERAKLEAQQRSLDISFYVSDMTLLKEITENDFDVAVALDNALPHLANNQLEQAAAAVSSKLKPGGLFLASIRDYDRLILEKPSIQKPAFYGSQGSRRIVHQVWDWIDDVSYFVHLYITTRSDRGWQTLHFVSKYHCLLRNQLTNILKNAGFVDIRWMMPPESGFYQPLVLARWKG
jgi:glycine/sarcosine N-methyltransferase